jgi:hypothetical protein
MCDEERVTARFDDPPIQHRNRMDPRCLASLTPPRVASTMIGATAEQPTFPGSDPPSGHGVGAMPPRPADRVPVKLSPLRKLRDMPTESELDPLLTLHPPTPEPIGFDA